MNLLKRLGAWLRKREGSAALAYLWNQPGASTLSGSRMSRPYAQSYLVNRAIKLVSLPITETELRFSTESRGSKRLLRNQDLSEWWQAPGLGPNMQPIPFADVIEATTGWLKLCGNAFWILDADWLVPASSLPFPEAGRTWSRFVVARPDRLKPVTSTNGALLGWEYTDGARQRHALAIEQVVQFRLWNPYDDTLGLGEMEAARSPAEASYLAGNYKTNLWANAGDRGPIITLKDGVVLGDDQRAQFIAQLAEKRSLAMQGIFKSIFIEGGATVEDPKVQPIDASVILGQEHDATAVAIAFGIPPSMFTVAASYSIGSASDRYRLIEDTCAPTARKISEGIERIARVQLAMPRLFAWFDWSKHSVFTQVRMERITAATAVWDRGMPWEKLNEWLNLDMPDFDGWEKSYLPFSVQDAAMIGEDDTGGLGETPDTPGDEPPPTAPDPDEEDDAEEPEPIAESIAALFRARASGGAGTWRAHMSARRPHLRRLESAITRDFMAARAEVLANLAKVGDEKLRGIEARGIIDEVMFDRRKFDASLKRSTRKASKQAMEAAGRQLYGEARLKPGDFKLSPSALNAYLKDRENKLSDVSDRTYARISKTLREGINDGLTADDIAKRIRKEFNGITKARAKTIALTEVNSAFNAARQEAMEMADVPFKRWVSSQDEQVRESHRSANGQTVRTDEPFVVGGVKMSAPGDPEAPPDETINCRCIAIPVMDSPGPDDSGDE